MAGYAKFWTCMLNDEWFNGLSCAERGFFMQLIVLAKSWGDTGVITTKSRSTIASILGLDGKTAGKFLGLFLDAGKINVYEQKGKFLSIEIVKYSHWQRLSLTKDGKIPTEDTPNGRENSPLNQTIPEHTKPEQSKKGKPGKPGGSEAVQFWMSTYQDKIGREYVFKKFDGINIAAIVKAVGLEEFRKMATWVLTTDDPWHSTHRTPGNILKNINDLPALMNAKPKYGRQPGFETAEKEDQYYVEKRAREQKEIDRILSNE